MKENALEPKYAKSKARHKNNEPKTKRLLIFSIKAHLVLHVVELNTVKEMFDALVKLFESKNNSKKLVLRRQHYCIMMYKLDLVAIYLMRVSQFRK